MAAKKKKPTKVSPSKKTVDISEIRWVRQVQIFGKIISAFISFFLTRINNTLLWTVGIDLDLINECPKGEKTKYAAMGALVFLISTFAFISFNYALSVIFNFSVLTVLVSLVWAAFIFSIDRFLIMVSTKKKLPPIPQDLKFFPKIWTRTKRVFRQISGNIIIRLFLVTVIAIVISKPLELQLMEAKVNQILDQQNRGVLGGISGQDNAEVDAIQKKIDEVSKQIQEINNRVSPKIVNLEEDEKKVTVELEQKKVEVDNKNIGLDNEIRYINQSLIPLELQKTYPDQRQIENWRRRVKTLQSKKDQNSSSILSPFQTRLNRIQEQIKKEKSKINAADEKELKLKNQELDALNKELLSKREENTSSYSKSKELYEKNGIVARLLALEEAIKEDAYLGWISRFLMIFFMCIEIVPVLAKAFMSRSIYDDLVEVKEREVMSDRMASLRDKAQKASEEEQKHQLELEKKLLVDELEKQLLKKDVELEAKAKEDISIWDRKLAEVRKRVEIREQELNNKIHLAPKESEWEKLHEGHQSELRLQQELNQGTLRQEALNNEAIIRKISEAHMKIVEEQIDEWLKQERANLKNKF